jgi:cytosine permease
MQTGRPLYVVGASTFGTTDGYLAPGLLMGFLQIGWVALIAAISADFIMPGLNRDSKLLFSVIVLVWVYSLGRVAKASNWIPLLMILIVFWANRSGTSHYQVEHQNPAAGFLNVLTIVIGFFATAGAAGADFGMNNRNRKNIALGGILGIVGGAVLAGGLPILSVAGYLGRTTGVRDYNYTAAISSVGALAPVMFFLFAAASLVPTCFSSFIASNSFSAMLPRIRASTLAAVTVSAILAITGIANHLVDFFGIVGASFGPIYAARWPPTTSARE